MSDKLDYVIKLVHPPWIVDAHRHQRIGFAQKYQKQVSTWPVGGKMLIYITDHKLLVAALEVTGTLHQGTQLDLPSNPSYPLHLPVRLLHEGEGMLPLPHVQRITTFHPSRDMSFWPISKEHFDRLLHQLQSAG